MVNFWDSTMKLVEKGKDFSFLAEANVHAVIVVGIHTATTMNIGISRDKATKALLGKTSLHEDIHVNLEKSSLICPLV